MTKRCSFCDYRTETQSDFDVHMRTVHGWGQESQVKTPPGRVELAGYFILGAVVAIAVDFIVSLGSFSFQGTSSFQGVSSSPGLGQIVISWAVTAVAFAALYKMNRWAGYGMLGGFVALFLLLAVGGGALGPYTCFSAYGYPRL
jgi:hypothetical protein